MRSPGFYGAAPLSALQGGAGRTFVSGGYYTGMMTGSDTSAALSSEFEHAIRFEVGATTRFTAMGLEVVSGTASNVIRLGVRYDNGNGYPGTLLVDAGTIDAATLGFKAATSFDQTLTPGRWWLTATLQVATGSTVRTRPVDNFLGFANSASSNAGCYAQSGITGALPASFSTTIVTSGNAPKIMLRPA